jgi:hypothetical protein
MSRRHDSLAGMETHNGNGRPVLDLIARMTADSIDATTLDPYTIMVARLAALVAVDAPPASYLVNLRVAGDVGFDAEQVRGIMLAIAPIVGTVRLVSSAGAIARALGFAIQVAEQEELKAGSAAA